jgi:hypothetical protein
MLSVVTIDIILLSFIRLDYVRPYDVRLDSNLSVILLSVLVP